ncbi:hypothetical protein [Floccifex sp.]|uniref:hypothetical protein n=1 Tax=Floccifex sp. TaxID=2815810 RepID=UPI003F0FCDC0
MHVGTMTISAETDGNFTYLISDNQVTITGYIGSGGNVVIPSQIEGRTVTAIAQNAFMFLQ